MLCAKQVNANLCKKCPYMKSEYSLKYLSISFKFIKENSMYVLCIALFLQKQITFRIFYAIIYVI